MTLRIHAGTVSGIPPAQLRVQRDYHTLITGDASCVGIWRTDIPELLTSSGGKLVSIANWKDGGPILTQATTAQQILTPVVDATLPIPRAVGSFFRANLQNYNLSGATFDPTAAYTTVCICKPTDYNFTNQAAGRLGLAGEQSRLIAIRTGGSSLPSFRHSYGTSNGAQLTMTAEDQFIYHRLIGSYDGTSLIPRMMIDDSAIIDGAASAAEPPAVSADIWGMGHSQNPFEGKIGMVGLFTADLLTDAAKATLLTDLIEWMALWIEGG